MSCGHVEDHGALLNINMVSFEVSNTYGLGTIINLNRSFFCDNSNAVVW
jgi:hypothetical protein